MNTAQKQKIEFIVYKNQYNSFIGWSSAEDKENFLEASTYTSEDSLFDEVPSVVPNSNFFIEIENWPSCSDAEFQLIKETAENIHKNYLLENT